LCTRIVGSPNAARSSPGGREISFADSQCLGRFGRQSPLLPGSSADWECANQKAQDATPESLHLEMLRENNCDKARAQSRLRRHAERKLAGGVPTTLDANSSYPAWE
jgi:hypothetical protein